MARFTTTRGFDRIVFFSDAAVAIALTLLVLPLTDIATEEARHGVAAMLADNVPAIVSLLISFVVIALLWIEHHRLFELLQDYEPALLGVNFAWLFAVVVMPFSTDALQTSPHDDRTALGLYIGNLVVALGLLASMRLLALARPQLIREEARPDFGFAVSLVLTGLALLAFVVAVAVPAIGMWALLLLLLTAPISALLRRRHRSAPAAGPLPAQGERPVD